MPDTNIAVSAVLFRRSIPAQAFERVSTEDIALVSPEMRAELLDVFARSKFDSRINLERRLSFLQNCLRFAVPIHPTISVHDCVDVKDNKFLECALAGEADIILSGDDHLLRLHPWRGIPIITPAAYLMLRPGDGLRGTQL